MIDLTSKQENFARLVALENYSYADAYRMAYEPKGSTEKTIHEASSRVANDCKVTARIMELRESVAAPMIANATDRQVFWTNLMTNEKVADRDKLRASELLGRQQGDFVEKIQDVTEPNNGTDGYMDLLKELNIQDITVLLSFLTFLPSDADIRAVIDNMGMVVENVAEVREYKDQILREAMANPPDRGLLPMPENSRALHDSEFVKNADAIRRAQR